MTVFLHGFGQRYDLPISLALYLYAAAGVVVISFVMVAVLAGDRVGERALRFPTRPVRLLSRLEGSTAAHLVGRALGLAGLATIVVTGLLGNQNPAVNPSEYLLWVYFWAVLVIASGLVGNLWTVIDPFSTLAGVLARFVAPPSRTLPAAWGAWPAVALYLLFALLELASGLANRPAVIGGLALAYTLLTVAGMLAFGRDTWRRQVEFVSVLFDLVSRFSITGRDERGGLHLRPPGAGLLKPYPAGWDRITFVILTLSSLAFDGVTATGAFQVSLTNRAAPLWQPLGVVGFALYRGLALVLLTLLFLAVFTAIVRLVIHLGSVRVDRVSTATAFALTLVPIALVYNAAHNYSYMVIQGQGLPQALAGAFRSGPQPPFVASFALANAATVWYLQVVLIVAGHVVAVYLAHLRASERFRSAAGALLSQYPMLVLMVAYTMTSLWILAQPTTRGG